MTRIRLKRERETLDAAGFAWSNPMYDKDFAINTE